MAEYEQHTTTRLGIAVSTSAEYGEATYRRFEEDIVFFRRQADESTVVEHDKKRYARVVILLLALYLESMANLFFCEIVDKNLATLGSYDRRDDLQVPIRRFRAVCKKCTGRDLAQDIAGLEDIFNIRNKIVVHPAGRAQSRTSNETDGWVGVGKNTFTYKKFTEFPIHYSHFKLENADILIKEVEDFVTGLLNCLNKSGKLSAKQLKDWSPQELAKLR